MLRYFKVTGDGERVHIAAQALRAKNMWVRRGSTNNITYTRIDPANIEFIQAFQTECKVKLELIQDTSEVSMNINRLPLHEEYVSPCGEYSTSDDALSRNHQKFCEKCRAKTGMLPRTKRRMNGESRVVAHVGAVMSAHTILENIKATKLNIMRIHKELEGLEKLILDFQTYERGVEDLTSSFENIKSAAANLLQPASPRRRYKTTPTAAK